MKKIIGNILDSFHNKEGGFSARKLTAFIVTAIYIYCHKMVNDKNLTEVLIIDAIFIAFLLGLITTEQIIKFKSDKNETTN